VKEFEPAFRSDRDASRFERQVRKDIKGRCTEAEITELETDRQLWLDELTFIIQDVQSQLSIRKAEIGNAHTTGSEFKEYLTWKASAMIFQTKALDRRRDVKAALKLENREDEYANGSGSIMRAMLVELKEIRKHLERVAPTQHV
jgi:hypothetical protein